LLQVFTARSVTHLLLIKQSAVHLHTSKLGEEDLQKLIQKLRKGLQPDDGGVNEFSLDEAFDLYQALLAGFAQPLSGVERLNIIVRGPLATLPFAVLITAPPEGSGEAADISTDLSWLIRRHSLAYAPSAGAWLRLRSEGAARSQVDERLPFFGIGNPNLKGGSDKTSMPHSASRELERACKPFAPASASLVRALTALPDTEQEIRSIASILSPNRQPTWLLFDDASEEAVYKEALERYRILYFATHGLLPGELKCQSEPGLVLTPPQLTPKSRAADGILQASEIASLRLNADTVVLSACNTAAAEGGFGGESLSGLAQSFFFAGARSLLVSHWQVPSKQTASLMIDAFSRLGPDRPLSVALQQAQVQMASNQDTAHPYFWAAFTLIGEK
jgi:CHAT domain-containing protein